MSREYSGSRVLVTGGLGFIGSNLVRQLVEAGADVATVDNLLPNHGGNEFNVTGYSDVIETITCDIRNIETYTRHLQRADYVFGLAGQTGHVASMRQPRLDLDINTNAYLDLLEVCRRRNPDVRIVYASTRQVYGKPDYLPVDESHPRRPVDVNGISKSATEDLHLLFNRVYGLRSSVLRLTNVYGPRMRVRDAKQNFLGDWIRRLIDEVQILVFGDGQQRRDVLYVDDCVAALMTAGSSPHAEGKVFNVGGTEGVALIDLARKLCDLQARAEFELAPFPAERLSIDIGDIVLDSLRIANELGWRPTTTLADGLETTVAFYRAHRDQYWDAGSR